CALPILEIQKKYMFKDYQLQCLKRFSNKWFIRLKGLKTHKLCDRAMQLNMMQLFQHNYGRPLKRKKSKDYLQLVKLMEHQAMKKRLPKELWLESMLRLKYLVKIPSFLTVHKLISGY